ncbi:MAG: hypothetical protein ACP5PP_06680 [Fervidobacterium sp.]
MSLKISLGGDVLYYLGSIGLFKALEEIDGKLDDVQIYCSGFSCIPGILWLTQRHSAYNILASMWQEAEKIFPGASKISMEEMAKNLLMLVKLQKKLDEQSSRKKLVEFFDKWIPDFQINGTENVKFCVFNLGSGKEELLVGNSKDVIMKAITYPIDFSPIESYISLSWVVGIPPGDVIIYIDWIKSFKPQRASDYLLLTTFSRTLAISKKRLSQANLTFNVKISSKLDFSVISNKFYQIGWEITNYVKNTNSSVKEE